MRDVTRRFNKRIAEIKRGKNVSLVTRYGKKMHHRIPVPEMEVSAERPMSKRQIWKLDPKGVMADAKAFAKSKPRPRIWWAIVGDKMMRVVKNSPSKPEIGGKTEWTVRMCDDSKQQVVQLDVSVISAVEGEI